MRLFKPLLALLPALALLGCSSMKVRTDYAPSAVEAVAQYRTYAWMLNASGDPSSPDRNPIVGERIQLAVDRELAKRGYQRVEAGPADFMLGWHASLTDKVDVQAVNGYYGYEWDPVFGPVGVGGSGYALEPVTEVREYKQGTLILDVVDSEANKLVWRGVAEAELSANPDQKERQEKIDEAAKKLVERFPPERQEP
ncbi:MAG: DUF4136 domain-containing protein [Deltaproteobacteria bacterium]|nr:DUF4136 domain-containing protein [Deltaproteobacteria bacterium]